MARVAAFGRSNCQGLFVQCLGENFVVEGCFLWRTGIHWLARVRVNRDFVVVGWGVNIKTKSK
jgi:hypothetical protein